MFFITIRDRSLHILLKITIRNKSIYVLFSLGIGYVFVLDCICVIVSFVKSSYEINSFRSVQHEEMDFIPNINGWGFRVKCL